MKYVSVIGLGTLLLLFNSWLPTSVDAFDFEKESAKEEFALGTNQDELGRVAGQAVFADGRPFERGFVAFFSSEGLEPMDFGGTRRTPAMIAFIGGDGTFVSEKFPVGSYFLGAMNRPAWRGGPPRHDEERYSAIDASGTYRICKVTNGGTLDLGKVTFVVPSKKKELKEYFTINGRLLDEKGNPIIGAVVTVKGEYTDAKALYISDPSAFGGYYTLQIPPGKYYLIARETVEDGGRPKPESRYGDLGIDKPIGVGGKPVEAPSFIAGEVGQVFNNVDIRMFKLPVPEEKRKATELLVKSNKLDKKSLPTNRPLENIKPKGVVKSKYKPESEVNKNK